MSAGQSSPCRFQDQLAAIVARTQSSLDERARGEVFEALSKLERLALIGGASDRTLRDIAEARFLTGILREAVRPSRPASLRTVLRARNAEVRPLAGADGVPI